MKPNLVKQALAAGQVQLGCAFAQLRSPEIIRILKAAGFHWAFLDTEHGGLDVETIQDLCRVASLIDFTAVVRVTDLQYPLVSRVLDVGAGGVVFPRVESAELLRQAISWTRFPPEGIRGFGLTNMAVNYEAVSVPALMQHTNANMFVVLQIETVRAVEAREELLSVPGVDAVMIGPADLSISLGVPGEWEHPKLIEAMEAVRDTCVRRGVAPGVQMRNPSVAKFWRDRGMRFLGCSSETGMLLEKAHEIATLLA